MEGFFFQIRFDVLIRATVFGDGEDGIVLGDAGDVGGLLFADRAPGTPKFDEDRFAPVLGAVKRYAVAQRPLDMGEGGAVEFGGTPPADGGTPDPENEEEYGDLSEDAEEFGGHGRLFLRNYSIKKIESSPKAGTQIRK